MKIYYYFGNSCTVQKHQGFQYVWDRQTYVPESIYFGKRGDFVTKLPHFMTQIWGVSLKSQVSDPRAVGTILDFGNVLSKSQVSDTKSCRLFEYARAGSCDLWVGLTTSESTQTHRGSWVSVSVTDLAQSFFITKKLRIWRTWDLAL